MRLDKYLAHAGIGTRSEVKGILKKGSVTVNGSIVKDPAFDVKENTDEVICFGKSLFVGGKIYYALNKPAGYVCSTAEEDGESVYNLLPEDIRKKVSSVGRLDKDTTGLLIFTDDGEWAHKMLAPKSHVEKTYEVVCEKKITDDDIRKLEEGISLGDGETALPAVVKRTGNTSEKSEGAKSVASESDDGESENSILLTIREGKYHQIKRMLRSTANKVVSLRRISFGSITLENLHLEEGEGREIDVV